MLYCPPRPQGTLLINPVMMYSWAWIWPQIPSQHIFPCNDYQLMTVAPQGEGICHLQIKSLVSTPTLFSFRSFLWLVEHKRHLYFWDLVLIIWIALIGGRLGVQLIMLSVSPPYKLIQIICNAVLPLPPPRYYLEVNYKLKNKVHI